MARRPRPERRQPDMRYQHAIPGRDEITAAMEKAGEPQSLPELANRLRIRTDQHRKALEKRLKAMVRDGQLIRNRQRQYCLIHHLDLVTGRVMAHRDGYGFLVPDDGLEDVYLPAREMGALWDGDRIAVRVSAGRRGGREGRLVDVLERATEEVVGRYAHERGIDFVVPAAQAQGEVLIPRAESGGAKPGDIVRAQIVQHPTARTRAIGRITQVVGQADQPGIATDVAILAHGLPHEWPGAVEGEVAELPSEVPSSVKREREDLRELPLVTIDGADAKDFDDAVYCESRGDGWRLIVAIADVSHYVAIDTPLDREARSRGTSVYFPDRVIPMLPEALSNGLCSLKPNVDRLCLACEMIVSARGQVTRSRFFEAVMRSAARLTYAETLALLEGEKHKNKNWLKLKSHLNSLREVYRALERSRRRRGAIDFDLPEAVIRLDEKGRVRDVHMAERLLTHRLIEECMIAANVEAAKKLRKARIPGLYRVHEPPDEDKVEELRLFLSSFDLKLAPPGKLAPRDISRVIDAVADRPEAQLIESVILRSMRQAVYQPRNVGHFGLALAAYAHFTSPIRRYPDLLVHRAIKWLLKHGSVKGFPYTLAEMKRLGEQTSLTERRADEAVWEVEEKLKCAFLEAQVGASFEVLISGVAAFGLFVRVPELQADGLIHVTSLPRDYYHADSAGTTLTGERSGTTYRLMDRLHVKLLHVDVEERKIDFGLNDEGGGRARGRRGRPARRG